jgi:transcriptional regulator with XRE-family HTH domain
LATALALTFQQVQKYELAVNRVGAARLSMIADALNVPISYFYGEVPRNERSQTPPELAPSDLMERGRDDRLNSALLHNPRRERTTSGSGDHELARGTVTAAWDETTQTRAAAYQPQELKRGRRVTLPPAMKDCSGFVQGHAFGALRHTGEHEAAEMIITRWNRHPSSAMSPA